MGIVTQPHRQLMTRFHLSVTEGSLDLYELTSGRCPKTMDPAPADGERITRLTSSSLQTVFPEATRLLAQVDKPPRQIQCLQYICMQYLNLSYSSALTLYVSVSITGSSDPAIVGKVIRSVLRQRVARNSDGQFKIDEWVQAIATPFSVRAGRSLAR